ncbi:4Fe-4S dicluster domain-containing protein [Desulfallas sp. Bu1-1]|uniref:4Fe-4S dicluster domain-containing protein n=1 Tax=Desulfallas sp. Bu1-1 TaxID=2787620 RepID=UPI00189E868D|nr:4Fe-4S dicluster domain-containing protein [Desulfallas sp. Bu1-1]MBF7082866.1 4Fe-4S dicluster domain-containing protein [Desulfallas sp. Bu1-1]
MDFFTIKKCFNCPNRVVDLDKLESTLRRVMADRRFNARLGARVNTSRPMHHQMFHVALAGCPNSCSQPQIKDFGVQGQARPEVGTGCDKCGACAAACPEGAITMDDAGAIINRAACLNCGQCARACPNGAMRVSQTGYRVLAGGKLGRHPRLATEILPLAGDEQVAGALERCVELFLKEGRPGERFGSVLERNLNSLLSVSSNK